MIAFEEVIPARQSALALQACRSYNSGVFSVAVREREAHMEEKDLTGLLQQLRAELNRTKAVDQQGRELLRGLDTDIRSLLERSEDDSDDTLLERLQDSIDYFETTHPRLTQALSQLLNALNNAGI
jgi:hypothetical protein